MSHFYLDTSAIVKHYSVEVGSAWVTAIASDNTVTIVLSEITLAEVAATLSAKSRAPQGISVAERDRSLSRFLQDCDTHYQLLAVTRGIIDQAVALTQKYRLRGYDAVQLATALTANKTLRQQQLPTLIFVSADNDLIAAAIPEGLATENPNDH